VSLEPKYSTNEIYQRSLCSADGGLM